MATIRVNGIRHFYRREGDRRLPALVLAHPIGFDHGLWDCVVPSLLENFHVLRYDLRGHGGSDGSSVPYSVDLLATDAAALLDAVGIETCSFVGTSLGGLVGLLLAITMPERLTSLVVANASAQLPLPVEEWNRRIALATCAGSEVFIPGITERMFSTQFRAKNNPSFHTLIESFRAMNGYCYAAAMVALRDADLRQKLAKVRVRTLVVAGESDSAVPRDHSQSMADTIPGARLVVLPGGHLSAVESDAAFASAVIEFCAAGADSS